MLLLQANHTNYVLTNLCTGPNRKVLQNFDRTTNNNCNVIDHLKMGQAARPNLWQNFSPLYPLHKILQVVGKVEPAKVVWHVENSRQNLYSSTSNIISKVDI